MLKPALPTAVPLRVRNACVDALEKLIPEIVALAQHSEASTATKLSVFDKLGKFGLSGRKTVLVENPTVGDVLIDLVIDLLHPTDAQVETLLEALHDRLEALGGTDSDDEFEDEGEPED